VPFPNVETKYQEEAVVTPAKTAEYEREQGRYPDDEPPEAVIICHQDELFDQVVAEDAAGSIALDDTFEFHLVSGTDGQIGVVGRFGAGAPEGIYVLERLIEFGVDTFVIAELCGCFQPDIGLGEIIVCTKAIRDEGTSYHYQPPSKYAHPDGDLVDTIEATLADAGATFHSGASVTTDAFYRDTPTEIEMYREEGVKSIEMEASAVFAVADYRGVDAAAMFVPSDYLGGEWEQHWDLTDDDLWRLYRHARESLERHLGLDG
jgi:uridine phosphorylase